MGLRRRESHSLRASGPRRQGRPVVGERAERENGPNGNGRGNGSSADAPNGNGNANGRTADAPNGNGKGNGLAKH